MATKRRSPSTKQRAAATKTRTTKARTPTKVPTTKARKPKAKATPKRKASQASEGRIVVQNVNVPGYRSTVDAFRYQTVRAALLRVLPRSAPGLTQAEMIAAVAKQLTGELRTKAGWWTKAVHLDLEAKRIMRRDGNKPLRWQLV